MPINSSHLQMQLLSNRAKFKAEASVLAEVKAIFAENDLEREKLVQKISANRSVKVNQLQFDLLETDKIFHIEQIKAICIDYRLRFLDSNIFKNTIPDEAISKIRIMEKEHQTSLNGFKIIAPSKSFQLLNYDDPLLFIPIGNNYYYLIHQWGHEISLWRKLFVLPIRNLWNFTLVTSIISLVVTLVIPSNNLSKSVPLASIIIFLFAFKSIFAVFAYYFFMMGKNFNEEIWQRQYYNN